MNVYSLYTFQILEIYVCLFSRDPLFASVPAFSTIRPYLLQQNLGGQFLAPPGYGTSPRVSLSVTSPPDDQDTTTGGGLDAIFEGEAGKCATICTVYNSVVYTLVQ